MQKVMFKGALLAAMMTGSVLGSQCVWAAETVGEFTLDPMVVTASRMEKRDLDTPAAVDVITREQVERIGGASAFEVLRQSLGVSVTSQGPNGVSYGSMTSEATIRGVERGTLVLVDGMPLNQDGKYNLEDIPTEMIEKIEIVRSGGSVLYGSEASGGVINIITKRGPINKVKISAGNLGRENYSLVVGDKNFGATAYYENRGTINRTSTTALSGMAGKKTKKYYRYDSGDRKGIRWHYDINDKLTFTHQYSENENVVSQINPEGKYKNGLYQRNTYIDTDNNFALNLDDKQGFKAHLSYGTQEKQYDKDSYSAKGALTRQTPYSWRKGHNTNLDLQKSFNMGTNKLLVGATYKNENMDILGDKIGTTESVKGRATYDRDIYSVYASYDWALTDKDNLIFNARETWAKNCNADYQTFNFDSEQKDMNQFTPEVQYIKKLTEDSSVYAKFGKSFRLPDLTRIYGSGNIRPQMELYPEKGTHYELGYKLNENNRAWRLALYKYDIEDTITKVAGTSAAEGNLEYTNVDTKSVGVELSCDIQHSDLVSSSWGVSYSNPEKRTDAGHFEDYGNRLQLTGSVDYHEEKFGASAVFNYLGKGLDDDVDAYAGKKVKPALYTDVHFSYAPEKNHKVFLHVNNIFDRDDFTTNTSPSDEHLAYLSVGRNFMLGYEYSF